MKLEFQVTNIELSKKLFELGVPQKSIFYWRKYQFCKNTDLYYIPNRETTELLVLSGKLEYEYSAFTGSELLELLPRGIILGKAYEPLVYSVGYPKFNATGFNDVNSANAIAKMLIYLLENKLIKL